jgi:hypothetical protein
MINALQLVLFDLGYIGVTVYIIYLIINGRHRERRLRNEIRQCRDEIRNRQ